MDMPPSRYKVVEKGRRLVVVDTRTGEAVRHPVPEQREPLRPTRMGPAPRVPVSNGPLPAAEQASRAMAGERGLTTQSWYDSKAPRVIQLTQNAQMGLVVGGLAVFLVGLILFAAFGIPLLIIAVVLLANTRKGIRSVVTVWLDAMEPD